MDLLPYPCINMTADIMKVVITVFMNFIVFFFNYLKMNKKNPAVCLF